jgi:hypothetical protein
MDRLGFILCICSTLLCVIYGAVNWNAAWWRRKNSLRKNSTGKRKIPDSIIAQEGWNVHADFTVYGLCHHRILIITAYLGFLGYRNTKDAQDFLLAGRKTHPVVMALSYGSTFISTSAIVVSEASPAPWAWVFCGLPFSIYSSAYSSLYIFREATRRMGHTLGAPYLSRIPIAAV